MCPRTNRKEETVMARLRIGHSFLTHSFLLKGEEPPMCIGSDELLPIDPILLTCSDLIEIRDSHFTAQSLCVLFQDISLVKIFNFSRKTNNSFAKFIIQFILKLIYDNKLCIALI